MTVRITILLDEDLHKKLKDLQAKMIRKKKGPVSFSYVINEVIKRGLKLKIE